MILRRKMLSLRLLVATANATKAKNVMMGTLSTAMDAHPNARSSAASPNAKAQSMGALAIKASGSVRTASASSLSAKRRAIVKRAPALKRRNVSLASAFMERPSRTIRSAAMAGSAEAARAFRLRVRAIRSARERAHATQNRAVISRASSAWMGRRSRTERLVRAAAFASTVNARRSNAQAMTIARITCLVVRPDDAISAPLNAKSPPRLRIRRRVPRSAGARDIAI